MEMEQTGDSQKEGGWGREEIKQRSYMHTRGLVQGFMHRWGSSAWPVPSRNLGSLRGCWRPGAWIWPNPHRPVSP